jgi:hypothetical protein
MNSTDSTDSTTTDPGTPGRGPRRRRRAIAAVTALAGVALTGGVVIASAQAASSPSPTAGTKAPAGPDAKDGPTGEHDGGPGGHQDRRRGGFPGRPGGPGLIGAALHGSFVVRTATGGTETRLLQNGAVDKVSATSITVRSTDGFTKTYAVTSATELGRGEQTIADITKGASVIVVAQEDGLKALAIRERPARGQLPPAPAANPNASPNATS